VINLDEIPWEYKAITIDLSSYFTRKRVSKKAIMALCYKGLAYHPAWYNNMGEGPKGWSVTHIKLRMRFSGQDKYDSTKDFDTEEKAAEYLVRLTNICNWNNLKYVLENKDILRSKANELYKTIMGGLEIAS
jgi:hypothetical protein